MITDRDLLESVHEFTRETIQRAANSISLILPYPISANRYWRTRVAGKLAMTYVSAEAKDFKKHVAQICEMAGIKTPIAGRIRIAYTLYPHRPLDYAKRMRQHGEHWDDTVQCMDLDNAQKVLLDALKGIAFDDDKWVREIHAARAEPDERGARVAITIWSMPVPVRQPSLLEAAS